MKTLIIFILCFFGYLTSYAQLSEDFNDGELFTNPEWLGDVSDFEIVDGILKLNAEDAGNSSIYTQTIFPDSIIWNFDITMDFAPSNSNKLTILLASKNGNDLSDAYYLTIGESGSSDALMLYKSIGGEVTLLGEATEGTMAKEPATAKVILTYDSEKFWTLSADYGTGVTQEELVILDEDFAPGEYNFFGISCKYTTSRKDKFYFDNFKINRLLPDTYPPEFVEANIISDLQLKIEFSEALSEETVTNLSNYSINQGLSVNAVLWEATSPKIFYLILDKPMNSGVNYDLQITGLSDKIGNIIEPVNIPFYKIEGPELGDIVINEILFDPISNGNDYIEIYNNSLKNIALEGIILYNSTNEQEVTLDISKVLKSHGYLVFTKDKAALIDIYPKHDADNIIEHKIPGMNNDEGNISIYAMVDTTLIMIDSFDYSESFHFPFLDDVNGVSLERIDPNKETNNSTNWHSAASTYNFGSPGLKNSVSIPDFGEFDGQFKVSTNVFSPDGDSFDDLMIIQYKLEENDYIFDVSIYDSKGIHVIDIVENETLASEGVLTWDGVDKNGALSHIGIYIVNINYLSPSQERHSVKKTVVLGRNL